MSRNLIYPRGKRKCNRLFFIVLLFSFVFASMIGIYFISSYLPDSGESSTLNRQQENERERIRTKRCSFDYDNSKRTIDLIQVANDSETSHLPKILCFVNTISPNHHTKAKAIYDTWGRKCDKLIFGSNLTDDSIGAVRMNARSGHDFLWEKHKATIRYVWEKYGNDYNWFYKADDDAYVIMENLRSYLRSYEIATKENQIPLQLGHRFSLPEDLIDYYIVDEQLRSDFKRIYGRWVFNSGGPGYAMNRLYMKQAVESFSRFNCLSDFYSDMLPDDASISFCMAWNNVFPSYTKDSQGRERWHADKPSGAYTAIISNPDYWFVKYHKDIGGLKNGADCCSPDTIAFHYMTPIHIRYIEDQLYYCRRDDVDSVLDRSP